MMITDKTLQSQKEFHKQENGLWLYENADYALERRSDGWYLMYEGDDLSDTAMHTMNDLSLMFELFFGKQLEIYLEHV